MKRLDIETQDLSECQRSKPECDFMRDTEEIDRSKFEVTPCEFQEQAACFKAKHVPSNYVTEQCSAAMDDYGMRQYRVSRHPKYEVLTTCHETE